MSITGRVLERYKQASVVDIRETVLARIPDDLLALVAWIKSAAENLESRLLVPRREAEAVIKRSEKDLQDLLKRSTSTDDQRILANALDALRFCSSRMQDMESGSNAVMAHLQRSTLSVANFAKEAQGVIAKL